MITFGSDVGDMILQRTLSESTLGLNYAIERMTSGYKVNHAKDNAAGYSIIADLNTKIGSMLQVQQNTDDGLALLQTAEGGLAEIQELLERLRVLTMQASNDSYGADARASMQQEADGIIEEIERIRNSITYNGMSLYESSDTKEGGTSAISAANALSRLQSSAKVSNAGAAYPEINNDTVESPAAFTPAADGEVCISPSSVSFLSSGDAIEGAVDLAAGETRTISIDGVNYTITNKNTATNSLSYSKDTSTGELTFLGSYFTIKGQRDAVHNLIISGQNNTVYGGDLNDSLIVTKNSVNTVIYGEAGEDYIKNESGLSGYYHGGDGNDTMELYGSATVYGDAGDDTIKVYSNSSTVFGRDGNDTITVSGSNVKVYGEEGDDDFIISGINNYVNGGAGSNSITDNGTNTQKINLPGANLFEISFASRQTIIQEINGIKYEITNNSTSA